MIPLVPPVWRPPSEGDALIVQGTLGCSWNNCTYCAMYRSKPFTVRPPEQVVAEIEAVGRSVGPRVRKLFVADGDALAMPLDAWEPLLNAARKAFPRLERVSCYAMARNAIEHGPVALRRLRELGLSRLYIGPESGDELTMRRVAKGPRPPGVDRGSDYLFDAHVEAARLAREAGMELSAIFLLGAGGVERSREHAEGSARLATAMDPHFLSALTLTVVEGTPLERTADNRGWTLPDVEGLLRELRVLVDRARPSDALFRTNHASNYLPMGGRLPADRARILEVIDAALSGKVRLRPEGARGL